jgi:hypothetical protein
VFYQIFVSKEIYILQHFIYILTMLIVSMLIVVVVILLMAKL